MKHFITAAIAATMMTTAADAAEIELRQEIQAGTLHEKGVDMVVYYVHTETDAYEVVATYAEKADPSSPQRMRMGLMDGDNVTFALPGLPETSYTFAREKNIVRVISKSAYRLAQIAD